VPYTITVPAVDGHPEESFTVESSRKPEAFTAVRERLWGGRLTRDELGQVNKYIKEFVVFTKIHPPKKADWWPEGCPLCREDLLRNDVVEHIRGFHGVERKVKG